MIGRSKFAKVSALVSGATSPILAITLCMPPVSVTTARVSTPPASSKVTRKGRWPMALLNRLQMLHSWLPAGGVAICALVSPVTATSVSEAGFDGLPLTIDCLFVARKATKLLIEGVGRSKAMNVSAKPPGVGSPETATALCASATL